MNAAAPTDISTKWTKSYRARPYQETDEVIYLATFADGRTEEYDTLPSAWHPIFVASIARRREEAIVKMAKLDVVLDDCAQPLPGLTPSSVASAVNLGEAMKAEAA